jgi:hypothetical protein
VKLIVARIIGIQGIGPSQEHARELSEKLAVAMAVLFRLPVNVCVAVLRDWVDMKSVGKLDSAACSRALRPLLISMFTSSAFVRQAMFTSESKARATNHLQWLIKRAVKVREWNIRHGLDLAMATMLLDAICGMHVQRVRLWRLSRTALYPLLSALLSGSNNVCELSIQLRIDGIDWAAPKMVPFRACTQNLHNLSLSWCDLADFSALLGQCVNLRVLCVAYCVGISDAFIEDIAARNPDLEGVQLCIDSDFPDLTDLAFYSLATHCGELLLYLSLGGPRPTGDLGLQVVSERCCNLKQLQLYDCETVTEQGLLSVVSSLSHLKELSLIQMNGVTDAVLGAIAQHLCDLTVLCLCDSCEYTLHGAELVARKLTNLRRIGIEHENAAFTASLLKQWIARTPGLQVVRENLFVSKFCY